MMAVLIDETDKRYGRLLVLRRDGSDGRGMARWLCRCNCGEEVTVIGTALRYGRVQSCGCLRYAHRLPKGESGLTQLFHRTQRQARDRNYAWELTREQVYVLTSQPCHYCGTKPGQTIGYRHGEYTYNGIDRADNGVGYVISNCVSCCKRCNYAKGTHTVEDFIIWAIKIADRHKEELNDKRLVSTIA